MVTCPSHSLRFRDGFGNSCNGEATLIPVHGVAGGLVTLFSFQLHEVIPLVSFDMGEVIHTEGV
jgi:hypothetical protein